MKNNSKKIIKTVLLSATFALLHGISKADAGKSFSLDLDLGLPNEDISPDLSNSKIKIIKNFYKFKRNGEATLIAAHRSHRSHSSHRSSRGGHYSHSSSSHYSHSSSSYGSGGGSSVYTPSPKTANDYSLGDRTLSNGIYGADVDQLVSYLINYYYLKEGMATKKNGFYVYDSNVVNALKHFQKDAGLIQDGKVTSSVITRLKNWSPSRTTISLGFRSLSTADKTSGYDVDELVALLINAGYAPEPSKLEKDGDHYIFTEDIVIAIKAFQAFNRLSPSGQLDSITLSKLKSFKK